MGGMGGVLHYTICFAAASCKENVQDGEERGTDDLCSYVHCPLEGLAVCKYRASQHGYVIVFNDNVSEVF